MRRLIGMIAVAVLTVALGAVSAGPSVAANDSNRDAAKRCQHGGWQTLSSPTGREFKNQGDCVSTGARIGLGVAPGSEDPAEAVCTALNGGGTFSDGDGVSLYWSCTFSSPPEPQKPPTLVDACNQSGDMRPGTLITLVPILGKIEANCLPS